MHCQWKTLYQLQQRFDLLDSANSTPRERCGRDASIVNNLFAVQRNTDMQASDTQGRRILHRVKDNI